MRPRFCTIAALTLAFIGTPLTARYMQPQLENVPIGRLIANLERMVAETPKDIPLRLNLARVHAMAFAHKTMTAPVRKGGEREGAWTGHEPKYTQFPVKPAPNAAADSVAGDARAR